MSKKKIRIFIGIGAGLIIAIMLTNILFIKNTPRTNMEFVASISSKTASILSWLFTKPIIEPLPTPIISISQITPNISTIPAKITPTITKQIMPTKKPIPTTIQPPTPTTVIRPTISSGSTSNCPATSPQSYASMRAERSNADLIFGNPETSPEINLRMRGFGPINKSTGFVSRGGNTYGLDDQMPPQISTLYGGPRPKIIKTYSVYEWNFKNNKSDAPNPATPNYEVTMIGLDAAPGQKLVGLQAGRDIGGGNVFMVLYATQKDIVFTHSPSDTLLGGYLFFFLDVCVDPNLLAKYQQDNAGGRGQLPVISTGQVFGYAGNTDVKVVVRDTMSFMDTRYKEDWWDYGK